MIKTNDGHKCRLSDLSAGQLDSRIIRKRYLSETNVEMEIYAPLIANSAKPGQFIVICSKPEGERFPLTISGTDKEKGSISIIFQMVGRSTIELGRMEEGEVIMSLVGPLGMPSEIENFGNCVVIGGGVGTAIAYPVAKALKDAGNNVKVIIGARTESLFILVDEMKAFADEVILTTDNGSCGIHGVVTDPLKDLIEKGKVDRVVCIGPLPMMKAVSEFTKPYGVKTIASLDPIMIDGTGMCGGCRVTVDGKTKFACVDGPEFDAHLVDWNELRARKSYYREYEQEQKKIALGGEK
ncbi:MAG: sulfide/dihydroorotate dehydrogenase-like FAD/NAD-binding protein [Armatimonadetes bacterium]|nr:sulfide/dihydroorotate dehydrogenase-like FAD/NAD-binding protein [Candidatus Hippobium faecium]